VTRPTDSQLAATHLSDDRCVVQAQRGAASGASVEAVGGMRRARICWALLIVSAAIVTGCGDDPPRVDASVLPLAPGLHVSRSYTDCSPVGLAAYEKNRPCDTYLLLGDRRRSRADALLRAERAALRNERWSHVKRATGWGFGSRAGGWIAPGRRGCAELLSAADGAREQARQEAGVVTPPGHRRFLAAARAASSSAQLYVFLQPGLDSQGHERCPVPRTN
jgi:hypothetical protein